MLALSCMNASVAIACKSSKSTEGEIQLHVYFENVAGWLLPAARLRVKVAASLVVRQVCKPYGYFTVVDFENLTDIWAFCVLRVVARKDNTGAPPGSSHSH